MSAREGARLDNGPGLDRRCPPPVARPADGRDCRWLWRLTTGRRCRRGGRVHGCCPRPGAQQHPAGGLCRFGALRQLPRGDHRGLASLAHAPHDAAAGGGADPGPLRRHGVSVQGRQRPSHGEGRRAIRRADLGRRRPPRLSGHARHRWSLPGRLRGRRGRRGRHRGRARAAAAHLVRLRDQELPLEGLLGPGDRAARPSRGRRLESDLRLLPQHDPLLR